MTDTTTHIAGESADLSLGADVSRRRRFVEVLAVMAAVFVLFWLAPEGRGMWAVLPVAYLLIERRVRRLRWAEYGFDPDSVRAGLRRAWWLIGLVGVVLPVAYTFGAHLWWPALLEHDLGRSPIGENLLVNAVLLVVAALGEEMGFRSLLQSRLGWFLPAPFAIVTSALVFAALHLAAGPIGVVLGDMTVVTVAGIGFGVIYSKTNNLYLAWLTHFLTNFVQLLIVTYVL